MRGAHLKRCDVCQWELEDEDNECPYCAVMARNKVKQLRFLRFANFTEWLANDGVWLILDMIGLVGHMREASNDRAAAGPTSSSDDTPAEVSPHSVPSKSVRATSRGKIGDANQANGLSSPMPKEPRGIRPTSENGARKMDREEKRQLRERIGEHLDVSHTRLTDDEAKRLVDFIDNYDSYRGRSETRTESHDGWGSDGKYTQREEYTDTFTDEVGIREDYSYQNDDGTGGGWSTDIRDARGILDRLKDHD